MKSRRNFFLCHTVPVFLAVPYRYTPKSVMDEIHVAHNDVHRLLFKLPRGFISVSQHFVAARIPNFTMIRRRHNHVQSVQAHFVQ